MGPENLLKSKKLGNERYRTDSAETVNGNIIYDNVQVDAQYFVYGAENGRW
jgi:hypothetical protein